jgi:hypothetical protein
MILLLQGIGPAVAGDTISWAHATTAARCVCGQQVARSRDPCVQPHICPQGELEQIIHLYACDALATGQQVTRRAVIFTKVHSGSCSDRAHPDRITLHELDQCISAQATSPHADELADCVDTCLLRTLGRRWCTFWALQHGGLQPSTAMRCTRSPGRCERPSSLSCPSNLRVRQSICASTPAIRLDRGNSGGPAVAGSKVSGSASACIVVEMAQAGA